MTLFTSVGIVKNHNTKLIVEIDEEISNYYFKLIPKYLGVQRQKFKPHISILRKAHDDFHKYDGSEVVFEYTNYIYRDEIYFWLNVFSNQIKKIRDELGLETNYPFHITLGNVKYYRYSNEHHKAKVLDAIELGDAEIPTNQSCLVSYH